MHPARGREDTAVNILFCLSVTFIFRSISVSNAGICFLLLVKLLTVSKYLSEVGVPLKLALLVYQDPDPRALGLPALCPERPGCRP